MTNVKQLQRNYNEVATYWHGKLFSREWDRISTNTFADNSYEENGI